MEKTEVITVHASKEFKEQVDDFKYKYRFKFRSRAIKYLLDFAMKQKPEPTKEEIAEYNK